MVKAVKQKYAPADGFEEALAMRLARAMWRMDRADRSLEGHAVRQAQEASQWRESRVHAQMMRMKMTGASLLSLAQSVARNHYVTSPADLAMMNSLLPEESLKEIGDIMLALFLQLRQPGAHDERVKPVDPDEKSRRALQKFKEIFGLAGDTPPVVRRPVVPGQQPIERAGATWKPRRRSRSRRRSRNLRFPLAAGPPTQPGGMGEARTGAPASGESPGTPGGPVRGGAHQPPSPVRFGSIYL